MQTLKDYIIEDRVDEGLIRNVAALTLIKRIDSGELLNGMLSLYEFICENFNSGLGREMERYKDDIYDSLAGDVDVIVERGLYRKGGSEDHNGESRQQRREAKKIIDKFYQERPFKERPLWVSLYNMYNQNLWSVIDIGDDDTIDGVDVDSNELIDVNTTITRQIRELIRKSRNKQNLNASNIKKLMIVEDPILNKHYIMTINKIGGLAKRLFKAVDMKFLDLVFKKVVDATED